MKRYLSIKSNKSKISNDTVKVEDKYNQRPLKDMLTMPGIDELPPNIEKSVSEAKKEKKKKVKKKKIVRQPQTPPEDTFIESFKEKLLRFKNDKDAKN